MSLLNTKIAVVPFWRNDHSGKLQMVSGARMCGFRLFFLLRGEQNIKIWKHDGEKVCKKSFVNNSIKHIVFSMINDSDNKNGIKAY